MIKTASEAAAGPIYPAKKNQRLNRHCSFREIFAERALMRTIVQFFFAKPAFGNLPGGHSDPVFIRSGNFSDEKDDLRKRTFRTISKRMPPPAVSPPPGRLRPARRIRAGTKKTGIGSGAGSIPSLLGTNYAWPILGPVSPGLEGTGITILPTLLS